MEKPLMSMVVKMYNQREYVDDCLKAAFAQTYSPLEIVITDNKSTDGTYERALELVEKYRREDGRHVVKISQNEGEPDIAGNMENGILHSKGELIIHADCDDISFPNRVQKIVEAWEACGRKVSFILSGCYEIDSKGRICGRRHPSEDAIPWVYGAVMAYPRKLLLEFGKLDSREFLYDDWIFGVRVLMSTTEDVLKIQDPLLFYRVEGGISTGGKRSVRQVKVRGAKCRMNSIGYLEKELAALRKVGRISANRAASIQEYLGKYTSRSILDLQKYAGRTLRERWHGYRHHPARARTRMVKVVVREMFMDFPLLLPLWADRVGDITMMIYQSVIRLRNRYKWRHVTMESIRKGEGA